MGTEGFFRELIKGQEFLKWDGEEWAFLACNHCTPFISQMGAVMTMQMAECAKFDLMLMEPQDQGTPPR